MKKKLISLLQRKRHIVALSTILMTFIVMSCLFIDSVDITQMIDGKAVNYAKAGTTATFKMHGHIKVQGDPRNDKRLVFGFLAPKSWNLAQNARVSYTEDTFDPNIGEQNMTLIPSTEQPSNKPGLSWSAALMQEYGVGTNILEDMEWAAYWTKPYNGVAGEIHFTIYVRVPVGNKNLRFKPSFFINSTDDNFSTSADAKKCEEAGCFEVVEGEGLVTDFCSEHFNKTTPLTALQNDFVTFSFIGGMDDENALVKADKIYFEGTAVASDGHRYTVNEKSDKTLMKRENQYTKTYNITFWPEGFFNVPEGTELVSIEYAFTNADGSISVTQSDDDFVMLNIPLPPQKEPFIYTFYCE